MSVKFWPEKEEAILPRQLEMKLMREGRKKGYKGKRLASYVYGTMNKIGAMHGNKAVPGWAAKHKRMGMLG